MRVFSNTNCPFKLKYAYMYFYFNPFSVQSRFYDVPLHFNAHAYMYTCFRCARNLYYANRFCRVLPRSKCYSSKNMLNVHHMHTWVCTVFKWNYEQHLYTHTLIPIINRFASTNEPLSFLSLKTLSIVYNWNALLWDAKQWMDGRKYYVIIFPWSKLYKKGFIQVSDRQIHCFYKNPQLTISETFKSTFQLHFHKNKCYLLIDLYN